MIKDLENRINFIVINMDQDKDRLDSFTNMMKHQNLSFTRHVGPVILSNKVNILNKTFNVFAKGFVGVAMAHLTLWENIANKDDQNYYVIFEDDEIIKENYKQNICFELKKIKQEFDFFNLNVMRPLGTEIYPGILKITDEKFGNKTPNIWLSNYIITSNGARKILNYLENELVNLNRNFDTLFVHVLHKHCKNINTLILKEREKYSIHDESISIKNNMNDLNILFRVITKIKKIFKKYRIN